MGKKLGLDAAYANLGKGYLQHPVINSVKPKPKPTKAMNGGMMQGYGAARTSGMGLEDQSLPPGQMVRASKGKMAKLKKAALTTTALLGANYLGKRSGEKAVIDSINSGQAFKPEGAKTSLFGVSLKRSKGGGMDMGKKEEPTQWITKKEKKQNWITKKEKKQNWITKKEK